MPKLRQDATTHAVGVLVDVSSATVVVVAVLYMEGLAKTVVVLVDVIPCMVMAGCSKIAALMFVTIQWKHSFSVDLDDKANSRKIKRAQIWTRKTIVEGSKGQIKRSRNKV